MASRITTIAALVVASAALYIGGTAPASAAAQLDVTFSTPNGSTQVIENLSKSEAVKLIISDSCGAPRQEARSSVNQALAGAADVGGACPADTFGQLGYVVNLSA